MSILRDFNNINPQVKKEMWIITLASPEKNPSGKKKQKKNVASVIVRRFNIYQFVYHLSYFL